MPHKDPVQRKLYWRDWRRARTEKARLYLGGKCTLCDATTDLEFHHKDPAQKACEVNLLLNCRWERLVVELDKCELRCHAHHVRWHQSMHGTLGRYLNWNCRCVSCVTAMRLYDREKHARYRREARASA